ncbi:MAG: hypothetical protein WA857_04870 [Candidatus Acidiferrum sp.]
MIAILNFATLVVIAVFTAAAAWAFDWLLLRAMFALMQPATRRAGAARTELATGARQAARAYVAHR